MQHFRYLTIEVYLKILHNWQHCSQIKINKFVATLFRYTKHTKLFLFTDF